MISQISTSLSEKNAQLVRELEAKLQIIRDRVGSVAHRYHTACYLVGRPGTSKTFTVRKELERLEEPWAYQNARMTPMGLFSFLAEHPEHVIVLDDIGSLFKNDQAMQILLAALDGDPGQPRIVRYKSKDKEQTINFTGTVIAISNVPLRCDPLARALGSRIVMLEHEPTDDEMAAFIRHLAADGYADLSPDECLEVAEFVISETREHDLRLDLRHLTKGWQDYRQAKHKRAKTSWQDLVRTSLLKLAREMLMPMSKHEDIEQQRLLVIELMEKYPNDRKRQLAEWPHSKSSFYDRKKEVETAMPSAA
jgi:hypothetical protein